MRTERGLDRLITFLDAVVAIAITLLVLPLVDALRGASPHELGTALRAESGSFAAFLLSFAVIARLWLAHHRLVEHVGGYDRPFVLVNMVWILGIVVLPFATQVVAFFATNRLAVAIYIGTITVSSACLSAMSLLVWRRPALRRDGDDARSVTPWPSLLTTSALVLALLLGVLVPAINYYGLLLLFLTAPFEALLRRRAEAGGDAGAAPPEALDAGSSAGTADEPGSVPEERSTS